MLVVKNEDKHHRLGGSTTKRWMNCAYSVPASEREIELGLIEPNKSTHASRLGTAAHFLGEKCLEIGCDPSDYLGEKIKVEHEVFDVDTSIVDNVQIYVDLCRNNESNSKFIGIEYNSELKKQYDEDVGGPCDHVAIRGTILYITDYKNGKYIVEAKDNTQLFLYALGCLYALRGKYTITRIEMTIVQPRADHKDGPCRSQNISVTKLLRWERKYLKPAIERVKEITHLIATDQYSPGEYPNLDPNPNDEWCTWCPRQGLCSVYNGNNEIAVKYESLPQPNTLTLKEAEKIIESAEQYKKWIEKVKNYYYTSMQQGMESKKFKLVKSLGHRRWKSERKVARKLRKLGLNNDRIYATPSIESPSQLTTILIKELGFKTTEAKEFIDSLVTRNESVILASINDKREAVNSDPADDFAHLIGKKP